MRLEMVVPTGPVTTGAGDPLMNSLSDGAELYLHQLLLRRLLFRLVSPAIE